MKKSVSLEEEILGNDYLRVPHDTRTHVSLTPHMLFNDFVSFLSTAIFVALSVLLELSNCRPD